MEGIKGGGARLKYIVSAPVDATLYKNFMHSKCFTDPSEACHYLLNICHIGCFIDHNRLKRMVRTE